MTKDLYTAMKERRSIYGISKEKVVPEDKIREVIEAAVKYTPSAFNSQSSRVVLLFDGNHDKLWDITKETLRKVVPEGKFDSTEKKINSFGSGYGTVLFFDDNSVVESLQERFPLYKDTFPVWAQHANGMLQYAIWTSLEAEGLGASLQHYNPLIDDEVKRQWNIPQSWELIAQMPFGKPTEAPGEKEFLPLDERFKVY